MTPGSGTRIVSIHEYPLRDDVTDAQFERALARAEDRDLFRLPGLRDHLFLKGIRGTRSGGYTALWIWESEAAWAALWGPRGEPVPPEDYPDRWRVWEEEILRPLLAGDPDRIRFTAYEEIRP